MDKESHLEYLQGIKTKWENKVSHAIQNEFNPYAHNGAKRLENARQELERINKEMETFFKEVA